MSAYPCDAELVERLYLISLFHHNKVSDVGASWLLECSGPDEPRCISKENASQRRGTRGPAGNVLVRSGGASARGVVCRGLNVAPVASLVIPVAACGEAKRARELCPGQTDARGALGVAAREELVVRLK